MKAQTAYDTIINLACDLFKIPSVELELIQRYKHTIYDITEFVLNDADALKNLISLTTFNYTICNHSVNVGIFSIGLTKELISNVQDYNFEDIAAGFFLHDIGKTTISHDILNKKNPLTKADWAIIRKHPIEGVRILEKLNEQTDEISNIIYQHHERCNGGGYPRGLKSNQIDIFSKICSIADTFDGLTSFRPYRKEKSTFNALKIMKNEMFKYFEPKFFAKFISLLSN
jgi:putative nucleotidyltransferase with HDIG domain